jgi:hypothetical protein
MNNFYYIYVRFIKIIKRRLSQVQRKFESKINVANKMVAVTFLHPRKLKDFY